MVKLYSIIGAAAAAMFATSAIAQTCYTYGDVSTCSNRATAFHYGGVPQPDERRRNPTPMYGGFGSAYSGNSIVFNNGRSAYTYGNTAVTTDGRSCYRYGTALICNRGHGSLAPSYSRR